MNTEFKKANKMFWELMVQKWTTTLKNWFLINIMFGGWLVFEIIFNEWWLLPLPISTLVLSFISFKKCISGRDYALQHLWKAQEEETK